jgi:hypothetical protein
MFTPHVGVPLPMVSTWGPWSHSVASLNLAYPSSGTFPDQNRAHYYPIIVPVACVVRRLWWANGAVSEGNIDVGVYRDAGHKPGARLVSTGSTAQGTVSQLQFVNVTDATLAPGTYWLAINADNPSGTTTVLRGSSVAGWNAALAFEEAVGSVTLPATATPVEAAYTQRFLCGFATTASP